MLFRASSSLAGSSLPRVSKLRVRLPPATESATCTASANGLTMLRVSSVARIAVAMAARAMASTVPRRAWLYTAPEDCAAADAPWRFSAVRALRAATMASDCSLKLPPSTL